MLQIGAINLLGLSLPGLLRAEEAQVGPKPTADACILIFLNGGPSHLDMWDLKPDAPEAIRGDFKPIDTTVPGVQFSEHLPRFAKQMHECTLIRSVHHSVNNSHAAAVYCGLTGHDRGEFGGGFRPTDNPAIGSVVGLCRPPTEPIVPYVSMPYITAEGAGGPPQPGFFGGWLGRARDPMFVLKDPNAADFGMPELSLPPDVGLDRFRERKQLVADLAPLPSGLERDRRIKDMDNFQTKAFDLLTSPATRKAFQLDREDPKVRERYGRNIYGQSVLLARRLVEAGSRVACISWAPDANATWDTHGNNNKTLKDVLLPQLDMAVSSLLEDLRLSGRLDRTLVAVMGEFGRSPRYNAGAGRDHWNFGYSLILAGGGIKRGYVHGSSDKIGSRPTSDPVTPAEVIATIYRCLGISHDLELHDPLDRPMPVVPNARTIGAILA
jgi:hypothetical protein